ncbi:MAG: outer membrane beta-barrel protein [Cyclonatronaceae bacterium]
MKIFRATLILLIAIVVAAPVKAQSTDQKRISITANTGVAFPVAPFFFRQNWNVGPGLEAGIAYRTTPFNLIQLNASYHNFGFDSDGFRNFQNLPPGTSISSSSAEIMTLVLNSIFEYNVERTTATPYIKVGAGFFRFLPRDINYTTTDGSDTFESESETRLMLNGAFGLDYPLRGSLSLFVEAKFVNGIFVDRRTQNLPVSVGIRI